MVEAKFTLQQINKLKGSFILDLFENLLLKYKNKRFLVIHPPGEKGDVLIFMGLEKKLKELNINHEIFHYKIVSLFSKIVAKINEKLLCIGLELIGKMFEPVTNPICELMDKKANVIQRNSSDVILLRGGGYLNDVWKNYGILNSIFSYIRDKPKSIIIIAPQSFYFTKTRFSEFFKAITQEVHIFCREKYSFNLLCAMKFPKNVNIHLSHDTAFYLTKEDFNIQHENKTHILVSPRNDLESVTIWNIKKVPPQTRILVGDVIAVPNFNCFVNVIANAHQVYSDRIHVAVLSAILGKETYVYPNSYYKNKGIYEFSLAKFSNVKFIASPEFLGLNSSLSSS